MALCMLDHEFDKFAAYLYGITGIKFDSSKKYLLETRLLDVIASEKPSSFDELHRKALSDPTKKLEKRIIDAVTTNETYFFRDKKPFDLLKFKLIPDVLEDPARPLSIWSAACSTGQEAYSITMVLKEILFDLTRYRLKIHGTDISSAAVDAANRGYFSHLEVTRGLNDVQIARYFLKEGNSYKVNDELRGVCRFWVDNLFAPMHVNETYDIILCRNVLIYFSDDDKKKVLKILKKFLKPSGVLMVGSTESLLNLDSTFVRKESQDSTYYVMGSAASFGEPAQADFSMRKF